MSRNPRLPCHPPLLPSAPLSTCTYSHCEEHLPIQQAEGEKSHMEHLGVWAQLEVDGGCIRQQTWMTELRKVFPMGRALSGAPSHLLCVEGKVA